VLALTEETSEKSGEGKGKPSAAETIVLQLKEVRDKIDQLDRLDIETLSKTIKDMTSTLSGIDNKVKGLNDLTSAVVRSTRELSEDVKSNTALMNMLMRALETKSVERETALLRNIEMSTDLIEKFTALVKSQTENSSSEKG
jgi:archaellum component FlaC